MADLNRRAFLRAIPAAAAVAAVPVAVIADQPDPAPTAIIAMYGALPVHQRAAAQAALREEGLAELAEAFEAQFPSAVHWSGNGRYVVIEGNTRPVYRIELVSEQDGAERLFCVSTGFHGPLEPADRVCRESELPRLAYRLPEYSLQVGRNDGAIVRRQS